MQRFLKLQAAQPKLQAMEAQFKRAAAPGGTAAVDPGSPPATAAGAAPAGRGRRPEEAGRHRQQTRTEEAHAGKTGPSERAARRDLEEPLADAGDGRRRARDPEAAGASAAGGHGSRRADQSSW